MRGGGTMGLGPREEHAMRCPARCPSHRSGSGTVAVSAPRHRQTWLAREDRTLRACAGIVPVREVAARLGRSRPAVLARARVLGLHWYHPNPGRTHPGHTLGEVA